MNEARAAQVPRALSRLARECPSRTPITKILDLIYDEFDEAIPFTRLGYATIESAEDTDVPVVVSRWARSRRPMRLRDGFTQRLSGSSLELVAKQRVPRILNDLRSYLKKRPQSDATRHIVAEGIQSSLTCPITIEDAPVAFLFFSHHSAQTYGDLEVDVAKCLAGWIAMVIQTQRKEQAVREINAGVIQAFTVLLGMANPVAADHAARMRTQLEKFAGVIDADYLAKAQDTAAVCNLGYVGVSEETTRKAFGGDVLTAEERDQIAAQYQLSALLCRTIPALRSISDAISCLDSPSNANSSSRTVAELVRVTANLESLLSRGLGIDEAISQLSSTAPPQLVNVLRDAKSTPSAQGFPKPASVLSQCLEPGMILDRTICSTEGKLLLSRGVRLTDTLIERIQDYDDGERLAASRISVLIPPS